LGDGVAFGLRRVAPAIEDGQDDGFWAFHRSR
jgi:hypothetical protein